MKTIEVTDEMYDKLMELSKEMVSQNPRGTAMPHMFQIRTEEEVAAYPGCGEEIWVNSEEGLELRGKEEAVEYLENYFLENPGELSEHDLEEVADLKDTSDFYLECIMEEIGEGWNKVNVEKSHVYKNTFFTAKACQQHIDVNHYHYVKPTVYLNHAWRNPEMELVSKFLCSLSGEKLHR